MMCLSAVSVMASLPVYADPDPLQDMEFFLFLAESETRDAELTTPVDLAEWQDDTPENTHEEDEQ